MDLFYLMFLMFHLMFLMLQHVSEFYLFCGHVIHCMYIPHSVFSLICWWHLGHLHLLVIVINAALNIGIQISVWVSSFSSYGYMPKNGMDEAFGNLCFTFWRMAKLFSTASAPFYIPTNSGSISVRTLVIFHFLNSYPNLGCEVLCPFSNLVVLFVLSILYQI